MHTPQKLIRLEKLKPEDWAFYLSIYTDPYLMRFIGPVQTAEKLQHSFKLTLDYMRMQPPKMLLFVLRNEANESAGIGILNFDKNIKTQAEIGVIICQHHQRKGYSYQAKRLLIASAFEDFAATAITAVCQVDNSIANHANQQLGFEILKTAVDSKDGQEKNYWIMKKR